MDYPINKDILDVVFACHPEVADCIAHRAAVNEQADDGVNFSVDHFEAVLKDLISRGIILTCRTEEVEREAELQRSKAERAQRMANADYVRKLKSPEFSREEGHKELRRLRQQEKVGKSEKQKALEAMTPAELRAKLRAEDEAKGHTRSVRSGDETNSMW